MPLRWRRVRRGGAAVDRGAGEPPGRRSASGGSFLRAGAGRSLLSGRHALNQRWSRQRLVRARFSGRRRAPPGCRKQRGGVPRRRRRALSSQGDGPQSGLRGLMPLWKDSAMSMKASVLLSVLPVALLIASPAFAQAGARPVAKASLMRDLNASVEDLTARVALSVVQVVVTGYAAVDERTRGESGLVIGRQRSIGSGAIVDPDGYIITNAHVVAGA